MRAATNHRCKEKKQDCRIDSLHFYSQFQTGMNPTWRSKNPFSDQFILNTVLSKPSTAWLAA